MSLRIYILRGYDLETDTVDLPYRVTRGINPGKAGRDREVGDDEEIKREKERGKWKERERDRKRENERNPKESVHGAEKYRQISHTCIHARTRRRF